jgi:hypothetical protein
MRRCRGAIPSAGFPGRHQEAAFGGLLMTAGFKPTGPSGCKSVELQSGGTPSVVTEVGISDPAL